MDYIEGLAKQASQLTMYDIKSYYNQARNAVLNVSEMEGKVREATNDDPWGASSTLMQQIADGTHNFQHFNEIMPTIYSRFMEKEAREWRQIYKALTLLEFLVKNGSERVVDDARAHISTIKMLRSFHYIDEKGKDQGINVRNRASEIASLLGDVDRIRAERRKAKSNKNKYQGTGNEGGMSFATASGGRYGGFGSESLGYPGGGGGGSSSGGGGGEYGREDRYRGDRGGEREWGSRADEYSARPRASRQAAPEYDEYEGADDFDTRRPAASSGSASGSGATSRPSSARPQPPPKARAQQQVPKEEEKPKKEVNLFDFGDDDVLDAPAAVPAVSGGAAIGAQSAAMLGGDDDFDDFQTAPSAAPISSPPIQPSQAAPAATGNAGLFNLLNTGSSSSPAPAAAAQPNSFSLAAPLAPSVGVGPGGSKPNYNSSTFAPTPPTSSAARGPAGGAGTTTGPAKGSTFDDLFTTSLSSISTSAKATASGPAKGKSILEMQQEKANAQLWGGAQNGQAQGQNKGSGGFDGLLF